MKPIAFLPLALAAVVGCASSGQPSNDPSTVPVYQSAADVPCEYEEIQTVRASGDFILGEDEIRSIQRSLRRELGRAGRDVNADGVIVLPATGPSTVQMVVSGTPITESIEGQAFRCVRPSSGFSGS